MYVYMYESLATTFREYKTLRMSEFYGMSPILLNPQPPKPEMSLSIDSEENNEEAKFMRSKMIHFYNTYKGEYNSSQCEVLKRVAEMPLNDVCLIQGPVSV